MKTTIDGCKSECLFIWQLMLNHDSLNATGYVKMKDHDVSLCWMF